MMQHPTTWQTVGPFFQIGFDGLYELDVAGEEVGGERMRIEGRILDGSGEPIPDCIVEIWQANSHGKYAHPEDKQDKPLEQGFRGFGRSPTDEEGFFRFTSIKPGCVPGPNGALQAPHLVVGLLMRGLLRGLITRAYFYGDPSNADDPILKLVPAERLRTLMLKASPEDPTLFQWTIRMQHDDLETVFFDF